MAGRLSGLSTGTDTPTDSPQRSRFKKWHKRNVSLWDGLRKDADLWFDDGDCLVYLYRDPKADRGPSFKIPWVLLKDAQCMPLLSHSMVPPARQSHASSDADPNTVELHLAAPKSLSKGDVLRHHITTRNFFAWLCGKPLVGQSLGQAMSDLLNRMADYRSRHVDNAEDLLVYADDMGYTHVECCADHALAMLCFAEIHRLAYVWTDAFAHCVGMHDELSASPEYDHVCQVTKALITRAYIEMDLHITRATRALSDLLLDDLADPNLPLSDPARDHLDAFRAFILAHLTDRHGQWPPPLDNQFPRHVFVAVHEDLQALYTFMADRKSSPLKPGPASGGGGVDVLSAIDAFDDRQRFPPLPHPLPSLPTRVSSMHSSSVSARDSLRRFAMSRNSQRSSCDVGSNAAAAAAEEQSPLRVDKKVLQCSLVQKYRQFDSSPETTSPQLSAVEACKTRWVLVYCLLQTVRSVVTSAKEVRSSAAPYPLCVLTNGLPTWKVEVPDPCATLDDGLGQLDRVEEEDEEEYHDRDVEQPLGAEQPGMGMSSDHLASSPYDTMPSSRAATPTPRLVQRSRSSTLSHKSHGSSSSSDQVTEDTDADEVLYSSNEPVFPGSLSLDKIAELESLSLDQARPTAPLQRKPSDMLDFDLMVPPPAASEHDVDDDDSTAFHEPITMQPEELLKGDTGILSSRTPSRHSSRPRTRMDAAGSTRSQSPVYFEASSSPARSATPTSPRPSSAALRSNLARLQIGVVAAVPTAPERSPTLDDSNLFPADEFELAGLEDDSPPGMGWSASIEAYSPSPHSTTFRSAPHSAMHSALPSPGLAPPRHSEDNMSVPSLEPGHPPRSDSQASAYNKRASSSIFSSLRSSRSLSTFGNPKLSPKPWLRSPGHKSGGHLSPDPYTSNFPHERVYIARQYSNASRRGDRSPPIYEEP